MTAFLIQTKKPEGENSYYLFQTHDNLLYVFISTNVVEYKRYEVAVALIVKQKSYNRKI